MKILAVDQSRCGGYAIFDYETKKLLGYGSFDFTSKKYTYPQAISALKSLINSIIAQKSISAVFIEDIALRHCYIQSFQRLAQLQGVLENNFIESNIAYGIIAPSRWQNYCGARSRNSKEKANHIVEINTEHKKESKILSIQFAHDTYSVDTPNDGIADAIGIGHYAINNIKIDKETKNVEQN